MEDYHENVIEFLKGQDTATTSLSNGGRLYNRVKRLADKFPDKCQIIAENKDGSIMAHIPESWIKINPPRKINMTEEQCKKREKRAEEMRKSKKKKLDDSR